MDDDHRAALRLRAASTPDFNNEDLPSSSVQYAAERTDSPGEENLYTYTDNMVVEAYETRRDSDPDSELEILEASKGGISDTWGDPAMNLDFLNGGPTEPQPNAVNMMAGSVKKLPLSAALRALAQRLPGENDPLTLDQENYGTGSHLSEADVEDTLDEDDFGEEVISGIEDLQLIDPAEVSQYSRESCMLNNTTENRLLGRAVQDGDFDSHGYQGADRRITQDPDTDGYLNIHASVIQILAARRKSKHAKPEGKKSKKHRKTKHHYPDDLEDETWEYIARDPDDEVAGVDPHSEIAEDEVEASSTSPLFNVAQQPMGFSG